MDEKLTQVFCEEFTREMNRLRNEANAQRYADEAALSKTERHIDRLVQALIEGVPPSRIKEKMRELEEEKRKLQSRLAGTAEQKVRLHPNIAHYYHQKIADLRTTLTGETHSPEATELVRQLIDRIVLMPTKNGSKLSLSITLEGQMAAILALATKQKAPLEESDATLKVTKLVAGGSIWTL